MSAPGERSVLTLIDNLCHLPVMLRQAVYLTEPNPCRIVVLTVPAVDRSSMVLLSMAGVRDAAAADHRAVAQACLGELSEEGRCVLGAVVHGTATLGSVRTVARETHATHVLVSRRKGRLVPGLRAEGLAAYVVPTGRWSPLSLGIPAL
jgi:hypothetical protein